MVYGADDRWLGFLVAREGTFLAVNLAGDPASGGKASGAHRLP
jgi:hypothetical protein